MKRPVMHRITLVDVPTPAWCNSQLYTENGTREWAKVTCKRCIRAGGEIARDEIGAAKVERRRESHREGTENGR